MPLINFIINLNLTWSTTCVVTNSKGLGTFAITYTKVYVPVVTELDYLVDPSFLGVNRLLLYNLKEMFNKQDTHDILFQV